MSMLEFGVLVQKFPTKGVLIMLQESNDLKCRRLLSSLNSNSVASARNITHMYPFPTITFIHWL